MLALASRSAVRERLLRSRALIGLAILIPFGALTALSAPWAVEGSWLEFPFDALALCCFFAGAAMRLWATLYIGGCKGRTLVDAGPYSTCRNPLYLGTFLITASVGIFLESLTFGAGLLLATAVYLLITVPYEEQQLLKRYGEPYAEYCRRVPRFVPNFRGLNPGTEVRVNVGDLFIECRRALVWLWIPILGELAANLRSASWWPRLLLLP